MEHKPWLLIIMYRMLVSELPFLRNIWSLHETLMQLSKCLCQVTLVRLLPASCCVPTEWRCCIPRPVTLRMSDHLGMPDSFLENIYAHMLSWFTFFFRQCIGWNDEWCSRNLSLPPCHQLQKLREQGRPLQRTSWSNIFSESQQKGHKNQTWWVITAVYMLCIGGIMSDICSTKAVVFLTLWLKFLEFLRLEVSKTQSDKPTSNLI